MGNSYFVRIGAFTEHRMNWISGRWPHDVSVSLEGQQGGRRRAKGLRLNGFPYSYMRSPYSIPRLAQFFY